MKHLAKGNNRNTNLYCVKINLIPHITMNKVVIFFLFLLQTDILTAQQRAIPISVSVFNESTAVPFTKFFTLPIHPGIQIGSEFTHLNRKQSRLFQTVNASYFYHNYLAQGIGINSEIGYEYRFKFGLALSALLGLGYMHTFSTTEEFTLQNGEYIKKRDRGNARLFPSLSFDLGFYVKPKEIYSPKVFIQYQSWAEYPYSPGFIPVMTHINLHLGTKFFIKYNTKRNEK